MKTTAEKVFEYFDYDNGFYIECGANDGITQSNTHRLQIEKNWKGILIEPSEIKLNQCKNNRGSQNLYANVALVSNDYKDDFVEGDFNSNGYSESLMASIGGKRRNQSKDLVKVQAKTLSSLLDELNVQNIDFFSLDVEGYEFNVLKGLDFNRFNIKNILIEIYVNDFYNIVNLMLSNNYKLISNVSNFTLQNNPAWDGTHNDYLFTKV
jgi:FkbM family methyltransferase